MGAFSLRSCVVSALMVGGPGLATVQPPASPPVFRTAVDLVPVTAVVRDRRGRSVLDLRRDEFVMLERGQPRSIVDFTVSDQGPVSLAVLMDTSGSMGGHRQRAAARDAVEHLLGWVQPAADEIALFAFDRDLRHEVPFTSDPSRIRDGLARLEPLGLTSLYDAIALTAKTLANRPYARRAVVVITDGVDTSSGLTPPEVSGLASAVDVPVYVVALLSPLDHPGTDYAVPSAERRTAQLGNLAAWTGGELIMTSTSAHVSAAMRGVLTELRHQYLLAFEAARDAGWYDLELRVRRKGVTVRARSGYFAGGLVPAFPSRAADRHGTRTGQQ